MNNKIFISGKITGDEYYKPKFAAAEAELKQARKHCDGIFHPTCRNCVYQDRDYTTLCRIYRVFPLKVEVVNPATFRVEGWPWLMCMAVCLWRLTWCGYVYMLHDWQESRGARVEHRWAQRLGKHIIYQRSAFVPLVEETELKIEN